MCFDSPGSKPAFCRLHEAHWSLQRKNEYWVLKARNKLSVKTLCHVLSHISNWNLCFKSPGSKHSFGGIYKVTFLNPLRPIRKKTNSPKSQKQATSENTFGFAISYHRMEHVFWFTLFLWNLRSDISENIEALHKQTNIQY